MSYTKSFITNNLIEGDYILRAELIYDSLIAFAEESFKVILAQPNLSPPPVEKLSPILPIIIISVAFIIVSIIIGWQIFKKIKKVMG